MVAFQTHFAETVYFLVSQIKIAKDLLGRELVDLVKESDRERRSTLTFYTKRLETYPVI